MKRKLDLGVLTLCMNYVQDGGGYTVRWRVSIAEEAHYQYGGSRHIIRADVVCSQSLSHRQRRGGTSSLRM